MYFVRRQNERFLSRLLGRCMSVGKKSYYEVLNVPKTCTDKDIRQAFIRMSKQLHPDKNKDANTHEAFVRVVEAYNVLSKPNTRAQYDARGVYAAYERSSASQAYRETGPSYGRKTGERKFYDDFYEHRERPQGAYNDANPYYGFAGNKKRTNLTVLAVCLAVTFAGVLLQVFVISASFQSARRREIEKSMRNARDLDSVRIKAAENGNEMQAQMMLKKISEASSHTVATATLAHTLTGPKPK